METQRKYVDVSLQVLNHLSQFRIFWTPIQDILNIKISDTSDNDNDNGDNNNSNNNKFKPTE